MSVLHHYDDDGCFVGKFNQQESQPTTRLDSVVLVGRVWIFHGSEIRSSPSSDLGLVWMGFFGVVRIAECNQRKGCPFKGNQEQQHGLQ